MVTEGRTSIRESLRLFRLLQQSSHGFELLSHRFGLAASSSVFPFASLENSTCGNFVRAFTSLFLDKREITAAKLTSIIDGSVSTQLMNHPNIVLHDLLTKQQQPSAGWLYDFSRKISKLQATTSYQSLSWALLSPDTNENLPRVFLVSATWLRPQGFSLEQMSAQAHVNDHKWVIVKNSNDNFCLLQNYIGAGEMKAFLRLLGSFANGGDGVFCNLTHEAMFGVALADEQVQGESAPSTTYWPSMSHVEINDNHIRGSGSRCMANRLILDSQLPFECDLSGPRN